jgi:hypothetical protein
MAMQAFPFSDILIPTNQNSEMVCGAWSEVKAGIQHEVARRKESTLGTCARPFMSHWPGVAESL